MSVNSFLEWRVHTGWQKRENPELKELRKKARRKRKADNAGKSVKEE
jgi:hypothetical protein